MAKRVNKRFLITLTGVVIAMVIAALGLTSLVFQKNAKSFVTSGDREMQAGNFAQAIDNYNKAHQIASNDFEILMKIGDAYLAMGLEAPENLNGARAAWDEAVTINPTYSPALLRLLATYWDDAQFNPLNPEVYEKVRTTSVRLLDILPAEDDKNRNLVESKLHISTLNLWLKTRFPVAPEEVAASVAKLEELAPRMPTDPFVPVAITSAYCKWAQEAAQQGNDVETRRLVGIAKEVIARALKGQEKNPQMQLEAVKAYVVMLPLQKDAAERKQLYDDTMAALATGLAIVKPSDPAYSELMIQSAIKANEEGKPFEADKIYQELLAKRPNDLMVRFTAGRSMASDKSRLDQAIELFARPITNKMSPSRKQDWEIRMLLELARLHLDKLVDTQEEKARQGVLASIDKDFQRLGLLVSEDYVPFLQLRARKQELTGDLSGAIQTYERAARLNGKPVTAEDYNLLSSLAQVYLRIRPSPQVGAARRLLDPIAVKFPRHIPTRTLLAMIALDDNDLDVAETHVRDLETFAPKNFQVLSLRATLLTKRGDQNAITAFLKKQPESSIDERTVKAQLLSQFGRHAEVIRLMRLNLAENKKHLPSLELLIRSLLADQKPDLARAELSKASEADPTNPIWAKATDNLEKMLGQKDAAPIEKYEIAIAKVNQQIQNETPMRQAIALGDLARRYGKADEAERQYKIAEGLDPSNADIAAKLYDLYFSQSRFDIASPYVDRLAKANLDGRDGLLLRARFALASGDVAGANEHTVALTKRWPEFGESWLLRAQAYQAAGDYTQALTSYAAARQRQGKSVEILKGTIDCYFSLGQPIEARRAIDDARNLFPNEQLFQNLLLSYEVTFGDPEKTLAALEQGRRDLPNEPNRVIALAEAYARTGLLKYARDETKRKQFVAKARTLLTDAAKTWPTNIRIHGLLADMVLAWGDPAGAEKVLKDFSNSAGVKDSADAVLMLANFQNRINKPADAIASLNEAMKRSNGKTEVRRQLVVALAQQRNFDEALKVLSEGAADEPIFIRQRIDILIAAGRQQEAEQVARERLQSMPQLASALRPVLATLAIDGGRFDVAAAEVETMLAADQQDPRALYLRALIYTRKPDRDLEGAMADLEKVHQIDPNNVPSRLLMADVFFARGMYQRAMSELEEGLRSAPQNVGLRRRLIETYGSRGEWSEVLRIAGDAEAVGGIDGDPYWPRALAIAYASENPPSYKEALSAMARAVQRTPVGANEGVVREYLTLLIRAGESKEVLRLTDEFVASGRKDWWIYQHRGLAKAALKEFPAALAEFDKALVDADKVPTSRAGEAVVQSIAQASGVDSALQRALARAKSQSRWKVVVALLYQAKGDWANALAVADDLVTNSVSLASAEEKVNALNVAAGIYQTAQPEPQVTKAKETYLKVIAESPKDFQALNNLAMLYAEATNPPNLADALTYSQRAYELVRNTQPMVYVVVDTHAWILTQSGRAEEALPLLQAIVNEHPFPEARYHLGEAFLARQRGPEAEQQLTLAAQELRDTRDAGKSFDQRLLARLEDAITRAKALQVEAKAQ